MRRSPTSRRIVTPDIKAPGSCLLFIDLGNGCNRLGGSALAQVYGQLGDECPNMDVRISCGPPSPPSRN